MTSGSLWQHLTASICILHLKLNFHYALSCTSKWGTEPICTSSTSIEVHVRYKSGTLPGKFSILHSGDLWQPLVASSTLVDPACADTWARFNIKWMGATKVWRSWQNRKRCHKCHNLVTSVALCVALSSSFWQPLTSKISPYLSLKLFKMVSHV